jgi:KRAB domain-containing zinc finger protein
MADSKNIDEATKGQKDSIKIFSDSSSKNKKYKVVYINEMTPCAHCGKLVAVAMMTRHLQRQHTSNDDKKYKCDVCGKGFAAKQHFSDHKNIHTGEKPYKCKFCSNCFASKGNHAMHERTHLGYRRK